LKSSSSLKVFFGNGPVDTDKPVQGFFAIFQVKKAVFLPIFKKLFFSFKPTLTSS
tara:strand:- start:755 stop:919 length:165 start_codon:yes stop_codon:yes gene_type:complete